MQAGIKAAGNGEPAVLLFLSTYVIIKLYNMKKIRTEEDLMGHDIIVFIPIIILITSALITKKIAEPMFFASVAAAVILYGKNFFTGYVEMIYGTLSNESYQFVMIMLMCFGGLIKILQESGAMLGFADLVSRRLKGPRSALLVAALLTLVTFVDDYISVLTTPFVMRETTDRCGIPREHLAHQTNTLAGSFCVLIPFSSWTAFTVGLMSEQGFGYDDYVASIPFMFYPIIASAICLLMIPGAFPKVGMMKKAYLRVAEGGEALNEKTENSIIDIEMPENTTPSGAMNAIVPIAVLMIVTMIYDNSLVYGIIAAIVVSAIMYISQKIMTPGGFFSLFFEGAKSMCTMAIIICFAFMLSSANKELGFFEILIGGIGGTLPGWTLPLLAFVLVGATVFATGGYWLTQVIAIPIFLPLAQAVDVNPALVIGAMMSGVIFGFNTCLYADPVFLISAGTGLNNFSLVRNSLPYALIAAVVSAVFYIVAGIVL